MIGVFISFTLSQTGMVIHWRRLGGPGWVGSAVVNGVGALATGIVLVIVAITKSLEGAWIILLLIPVLVVLFEATRSHYRHVASQLSLKGWEREAPQHSTVLVPIGGVHRAVLQAVAYARSLSADVRGIYVDTDATVTAQVRADWSKWADDVPLVVLDSPYRSLMEPLLEYIEQLQTGAPSNYLTVVLPEFIPARWWQHLLHNQQALLIKGALLFKPRLVVTSVPFHLAR
jgi:hypothetical protein